MTMAHRLRWVLPVKRAKQSIFAAAVFLTAFFAFWIAVVRAVPGVRRRKAKARATRAG